MKPIQAELTLASDLRTVLTRLIKKMRNASPSSAGLSLTERSTMSQLDKSGPLSPTGLAAREKITNQSMSAILQHLAELGLIIRKTDNEDKRRSVVSLSRSGREKLLQVRGEKDEWLSTALAEACNVKDLELLRRVIEPLTKLVDHEPGAKGKGGTRE